MAGDGDYDLPHLFCYNNPGLVTLSDWSLLPAVLNGGGSARIRATTGVISSLTIANYSLFLDYGWDDYRLRAGNVIIQNAGKIKHIANTDTASLWVQTAGVFIQCTNLTVESGGQINVDELGYQGKVSAAGNGPGGGGYDGSGGGGGHGGKGGSYSYSTSYGGPTYGADDNPITPGSAGGGQGNGRYGGHGGGYVKVVASGNVAINGTGYISANGGKGSAPMAGRYTGGGSGGGINIQCATLSGNGIIRANAAYINYNNGGGGGGGGRIAITTTSVSTFSGTISADGGDKGEVGVGGTGGRIAIVAPLGSTMGVMSAKAGDGDYDFPHPYCYNDPGLVTLSDWSMLPAVLNGGGSARIRATTGVISSLTIANYQLFLDYGWDNYRLRAGNIIIQNAGKIRHTWNTDTTSPWTLNGAIMIECANLTLQSGGWIDADGAGYLGGTSVTGYGPGKGTYVGGGGGYGGAGGKGPAGAAGGVTYYTGSDTNPASSGSGAAGGSNNRKGGAGGGYIRIEASRTVTLDGGSYISASGGNGIWAGASRDPGGGSGGGINIRCRNLAGDGTLRANGGTGLSGAGGGGGGGRIAVFYTGNYYTGTTNVNGGTANSPGLPGAAGSVYFECIPAAGTIFMFQ